METTLSGVEHRTTSEPDYMIELEQKLRTFRACDLERDQLLENLLQAYQTLRTSYNELYTKAEREQYSRQQWQAHASELETSLKNVKIKADSDSFVAVLINGDGAPFLDDLFFRNLEGGKDAACLLHDELSKHIDMLYPDEETSDWKIVVSIYINLDGMRTRLKNCGVIGNTQTLNAFVQSFCAAKPLFQILDIGPNKDSKDTRLQHWFDFYKNNSQCKRIILGGICHDDAYLSIISAYERDQDMFNKTTLLWTLPVTTEYKAMKFHAIQLPKVFRTEHLPGTSFAAIAGSTPMSRTHSGIGSAHDSVTQLPATPKGRFAAPSPSPSDSSTTSWAKISKIANDSQQPFQKVTKKRSLQAASNPRYVILNEKQERLDNRIDVDKSAQDKLFRRIKDHGKICNPYHLTGKCPGSCGFIHGDKFSVGELLALRQKARTRACAKLNDCTDQDCIHGHVCTLGNNCRGEECSFESVHDKDLIPHVKLYEDGRIALMKESW